jgi:serine phosphatase RsbU (regulator of sigma subunit)
MQPSDFAEGQLDIFAHMIPVREVGGDLYDIVKLDGNRVVITIGDVCGKGIPASLFMAITQTVMRLVVRAGQNLQAEIINQSINDATFTRRIEEKASERRNGFSLEFFASCAWTKRPCF